MVRWRRVALTPIRRLLRLTRAALFGSKPKVQLAPEPPKRRSLFALLFGKKKPPAVDEAPEDLQEPPAVVQKAVVQTAVDAPLPKKKKTGWFWSRSSAVKAAQNLTEPSYENLTDFAVPQQPATPEVPADAEPKLEPRLSWRSSENRLRQELEELRSERDSAIEASIRDSPRDVATGLGETRSGRPGPQTCCRTRLARSAGTVRSLVCSR